MRFDRWGEFVIQRHGPSSRNLEGGFMMRMTKVACLAVAALGFSMFLAGCGGPDNEKVGDLTTDGKPTPVTAAPAPAPKSSDDAYKSTQQNLQATPGYPKKK